MTEKVRVAVRIRPLPNAAEGGSRSVTPITSSSAAAVVTLDEKRVCVSNRRVYQVDHAFNSNDSTEFIFYESVVSLIDRFLDGYNTTVLAYGQTGSGKTYTMDGLTPLVLRYIVERMGGVTSHLSFQYVEVYGEALRDLLTTDPIGSTKHLQLHDADNNNSTGQGNGNGGAATTTVVVVGATRVKARNMEEVYDIINHGARMRTTGATNMNEHSSRSHSIFTVFNHQRRSKLNLVDLAGSERNKKTLNVGQRFRESIAINGGLLALGNVIRALSRNHFQCPDNPRHVPYRSSKLTRLLQDSLGGNSVTLLIACVASDVQNTDETTRTLQYSALSMHILNEPLPQFDERAAVAAEAEERKKSERRVDIMLNGEQLPSTTTVATSSNTREVLELRERVAVLEEQMQRCCEELKNDERVFAQQIHDMRRLLEENESLKRRVAFLEGRPHPSPKVIAEERAAEMNTNGIQQEQKPYQWMTGVTPLSLNYMQNALQSRGKVPQYHMEPFANSRPTTRIHSFGLNEGETMMEAGGQQEDQHHQKISKISKIGMEWNEGVAAAAAAMSESIGMGNNSNNSNNNNNNNNNHYLNNGGNRLTNVDNTAKEREEQLSLLAKEALYYQNSNSELRRRLRTVLEMYEVQQREASMLRREVKQIHDLLESGSRS
ncbi:Kinesin motor domain [Trypanosoma melophagium]|uniref:Kinesin motor domain n=1 Tax=Trypanosoma melophagium TaxID=715481 RepID=UPI00351A20F5|nr:Kinesin motor domain [Trypanosoma melophagium]